MNNAYKLVFSAALQTWVAVAEHVRARGKQGAVRLRTAAVVLAGGAIATGGAQAGPPAVNQLPTGAQVAAGTVGISQTQSAAAASMAINQSSPKAIVNWHTFNVGANAKVNITQPSNTSVLLNRVQSSDPSQIFGQIKANGQVFLTNPNGVYFAPGSSVDVGSITATTHSISDANFLGGNYSFSRHGAAGSIVNEGSLTAGLGGYIALLAPEVRNQGVVLAQVGGTVALAAGEGYQLQLNGNGQLTNVLVTPASIQTLVDNGNAVQAPDGLIILSAQAAHGLVGGVVKNSGAISATGLVSEGGTIRLSASHKIELAPSSSISADAAPNSAGNGGRIDIIADLSNANSQTQVNGNISARGGDLGGEGGFVETSAANLRVADSARVSTLAPQGQAGNWLLDPNDFEVSSTGNISGSALSTLLASGNVTLQAGTGTDTASAKFANVSTTGTKGDINIYDDVSWSANTLTLNAGYNINVGSSTRTGSLTVTGAGALALNPSSSLVTGFTTGGMVLMGMASTPTGGPAGNGFNGRINLSATDSTRLIDSSSSPVLKISGNNYTVIKTLGSSSDYSTSSNNYTLQGMAASNNVGGGKYFALGNDIDATATSTWTNLNGGLGFFPIGKQAGNFAGGCDCRFWGVFDGLGHAVTNLYEYRPNLDQYNRGNVGLIAYALISSRVANIGVTGNMSGQTSLGGLVGAFDSTSYSLPQIANSYSAVNITVLNSTASAAGGLAGTAGHVVNSYATGNVAATGASNVGGLVGAVPNYGTTTVKIDQSYATGQVSGSAQVGGLIGYIASGTVNTVTNSYATGNVSGTGNGVGGLVGNATDINVSSSYATGTVSGAGNVGGLVGSLASSNNNTVTSSYGTGNVSGTGMSVGGLIGDARGITVSSSYATGTVSGVNFVGGLVGFAQPVAVAGSYATGSVTVLTGGSNGGGLVGYLYGGSIASSFASGNVSGSDVGGLTGTSQTNASISNSYAAGNVTLTSATGNAGGLIAYLPGTSVYSISNNYASGTVSQTGGSGGSLGALVGFGTGRVFSDNYWNSTKNPSRSVTTGGIGGSVSATSGVTAISTSDMKSASSFSSGFGNSSGAFTVASGWGYATGTNSGFPVLCALTSCTGLVNSFLNANFIGAAGGLWSVGSNWDLGYAPSAGNSGTIDAAIISAGSSVNYDTGSAGSLGVSIQNAGSITFTGSSNVTLSGLISGAGSLALTGSGRVTLSGANTYTGGTTISAGTLQIGAGSTNGSITGNVSNNGALDFNRSDAVTFSGVISGAGAVTQSGTGTTTLSGTNTYTGGTTVSAGTLKLGSATAAGTGAIGVSSGAALDLNGQTLSSTGTLTLNGTGVANGGALVNSSGTAGTYAGAVTLASDTSYGGTGSITFGSTVNSASSGAYALSSTSGGHLLFNAAVGAVYPLSSLTTGTGTTTLGANVTTIGAQTYGGPVVVKNSAGVTLSNTNSAITFGATVDSDTATNHALTLSNGTGATTFTGAIGATDAIGALTVNGTGTITLGGNVSTFGSQLYAGPVNAAAGITITANAGVTFSQASTASGALTINTSALSATGLSAGGALSINNSGAADVTGAISNNGANAASLVKSGAGTLTLSGANTYTGGTTVSAGTLQAGAGGTSGALAGDISNNGTLVFNRSDAVTYSGVISGTGALTKSGAGTTTLTGANTYTGATTVSSGTLAISNATGLGATAGGVTVVSGATLDLQGAAVGAEAIALNGGTLATSAGTSSLAGAVTLGANSTIDVAGSTSQLTLSGLVSGAHALTKSGTGNLIMAGQNTFSGGLNIAAGTATEGTTYNGASGPMGSGTVTVQAGATLDLNNYNVYAPVALAGGALVNNATSGGVGQSDVSLGMSLMADSILGGAGFLNAFTAVAGNGHGLVLLGTGTKNLTNVNNTLTRLASGSGVGALNVVNNQGLTIGQVTAGGTLYSGINSTGSVSVRTRTGDLTVSHPVATTSNSNNSNAPALDLRAGTLTAAGTVTGGDLVLSGSPSFSVGANGLAVFYSGHSTTVDALALISNLSANSPFDKVYNQDSSYSISGSGFRVAFRGAAPVNIYLLPASGQSSTYGTAPASLSYCYSSSAASCVNVSYAGIPSTLQSFSLASGALSSTVNVAGGVSGSLALAGSPSIASTGLVATTNAATYSLTLTPSLTLAGYNFAAGNAVGYTVNRKPVTVTNTARTTTYDGVSSYTSLAAGTAYSVGALVGADAVASVTQTPTGFGGPASGVAAAGSYTITPSAAVLGTGAASNYNFTYVDSTHTVNKANATVTGNSATVTYNGSNQTASGFTASGLVGGETEAVLTGVTASRTAKNAGSYAVTPSGTDGNYNLSFVDGTLVINKANATVTGNSATVTYNGANQTASGFTASGLVGGETEAVLAGVTASRTAKNAGSYAVTPSGTDSNYNLSFVDGTLVINKANATVTGNSSTVTYNGANQTASGFTASGLVGGETESVLTGVSASRTAKNAGNYAVTPSGTDSNYNLSVVDGTLVINKANATVTGNSSTVTYNGANQTASGFTASGLVGGETEAVLTGVSASRTAKNSGSYAVTPSGTDSNYNLSFVDGNLVINKANATVTGNSSTVTYNGANQTASGFTASGLVGGETESVLTGVSASRTAKNAGNYAVTPSGTDSNYNLSFVDGTLVINKANATVTGNSATVTYSGANQTASGFTASGLVGGETEAVLTGVSASRTAKNAGSYAVTPSGTDGNYNLSFVDGTLVINKANATVTGNSATVTYNGANQTASGFTASGLVGGETESVLTGVSASRTAKNAGNYAVTPSGTDSNYNLSFVDGTLVISKANATVTGNSATVTYNGANQTASGFTASGLVGGETESVLTGVSASRTAKNAGNYAVTPSGTDSNYNLSFVDGTLVINKANATVTGNSATVTYNGANQTASGFTASGLVGGETESVLTGVSASRTAKNAGNYAVTPSGTDSNYNLSFVDGTLVISKANATVTGNSATVTYSGANQTASGFTASGLVGGETEAVLTGVSASRTAKNAGSYAVTPSGTDGNYNLSFVDGTLVINKANATVTGNSATVTYNGANQTASGFTASGLVGGETESVLTGVSASRTAKNAGNYAVTPSGTDSNYNLSFVDGTLVISKANATVTGNSATVTYNGANQTASGFTASGLVGGETESVLTGVSASRTAKNAGNYAVMPSGTDSNYNLSFVDGTLVINKANATVTGNSSTVTYNGANQTASGFTASGLVGGETEAVLTGVSASRTAKNSGSYAVTPSGTDSNYNLSFVDGNLVINKANATVTGNSSTVTYNGANQTASGFTASGLVGGETESVLTGVSASRTAKNAGNYAVTPSGTDSNYNLSFVDGTLVINKANATVTGNSATVTYSGANQTASGFTASGLVGGETEAVLTGVSASRTAKNAGSYAVTPSGTDGNYNLSFVDGTLVITKANATVTGNSSTVTYNGANQTASGFTASGLVGGETEAVLTGVSASRTAKNAGSYAVTPSGTDGNYNLSFVDGTLQINKAPLLIAATSNTKSFDGNASAEALPTVSGLKGSDTVSNLSEAYADLNPGNGKTLLVQETYRIEDGQGGGNYSVTLEADRSGVIRSLPVAVLPPAVRMATIASVSQPSIRVSGTSTAPASSSASVNSSPGVSVNTISQASQQLPGLVAVSVPGGTATAGTGLVIALPEAVVSPSQDANAVNVSLPDSQPLPAWIRYDATTQSLITGAVPAGAFPISVLVTVGSQSTLVQISETAGSR